MANELPIPIITNVLHPTGIIDVTPTPIQPVTINGVLDQGAAGISPWLVTGTFWQATQPVSIATMPTTPVTGSFLTDAQLRATAVPVSQSGTWNVGVNNFPDVQKTQLWPLTIKAEYSGANLLIYFADALPGTLTSAASWRIRKLLYDGNGNFTTLGWPSADTSFSYVWDNRATYTYS